jgi:hypothetical protein
LSVPQRPAFGTGQAACDPAAGSCFVVTGPGLTAVEAGCLPVPSPAPTRLLVSRPTWDAGKRELWLDDLLIKAFKQPAPTQELILVAFEEEGWPPWIDDPLIPERGKDAKHRLHAAIRNLNRARIPKLIHFAGGGNGQSIAWELVEVADL